MAMPPMIDKFDLLEALEDMREETAAKYVRGAMSHERAFDRLITLYEVTERVNALPVHLDLTAPLGLGRKIEDEGE